jgi:hypothetical protein
MDTQTTNNQDLQTLIFELRNHVQNLQSQLQQQANQLQQQSNQLQQQQSTVTQTTVRNNIVKPSKPKPFTGKRTECIETWIFQVEQYLRISPIEETQRIPFAASFFEDKAAIWWRSVYQDLSKNNTNWSWNDFVTHLRQQFRPVNANKIARDRLATLQQTNSVQAYTHLFRTTILEITDISEAEKLDRYVRGLKPYVRREVELRSPKNFDEAIIIADRVDAITYSLRTSSYDQQKPTKSEPMPMELDAIRQKSLTNSEREQLRRTGGCFYCRGQGHISRNCPKKKRSVNAIESEFQAKDSTQ